MTLRELLRDATGTVRIPPGRYFEQLILSGRRDLHIIATGVTLDGSRAPKGQSGLRVMKCSEIAIEGLTSQHWTRKTPTANGGQGIFITDSTDIKLIDLTATSNHGSGLLTGGVNGLLVRGGDYNDNRGHGGYVSRDGKDVRIEGVTANGNGSCGWQINGRPGRIEDVVVGGSHFNDNGNAAVQMAFVTDGLVEDCDGKGNRQNRAVFWNDGSKKGECRTCREEGNSWA